MRKRKRKKKRIRKYRREISFIPQYEEILVEQGGKMEQGFSFLMEIENFSLSSFSFSLPLLSGPFTK